MAWICVRALAGDGTAIGVDTMAMTGAETGASAGVGNVTAEGREAEAWIWDELAAAAVAAAAATWTGDLTETGDKAGAGAEVKPGTELKTCVWTWEWGAICPGTGSDTAVWVCDGNEAGVRVETWVWTMAGTSAWVCAGTEAEVRTF